MNYRSYNPFAVLNILDLTISGDISWPEMFVYQNGKKTSALYQGLSSSADMEAKIVSLGGFRHFFVLLAIYFDFLSFILFKLYKRIKSTGKWDTFQTNYGIYGIKQLKNSFNTNLKDWILILEKKKSFMT